MASSGHDACSPRSDTAREHLNDSQSVRIVDQLDEAGLDSASMTVMRDVTNHPDNDNATVECNSDSAQNIRSGGPRASGTPEASRSVRREDSVADSSSRDGSTGLAANTRSSVQWQWKAGNAWRNYDSVLSSMLENVFLTGQSRFAFDIDENEYVVDFMHMLQKRKDATNHQREVRRVRTRQRLQKNNSGASNSTQAMRQEPTANRFLSQRNGEERRQEAGSSEDGQNASSRPELVRWQWQLRAGWQDYSRENAEVLELCYRSWQDSCVLEVPSGIYKVDFRTMTQRNVSGAGNQRAVQRLTREAPRIHPRVHRGVPPSHVPLNSAEHSSRRNDDNQNRVHEVVASSGSSSSSGESGVGCVICYNAQQTHAFVPCGHLCLCEACANKYKSEAPELVCPLCRAESVQLMKIIT